MVGLVAEEAACYIFSEPVRLSAHPWPIQPSMRQQEGTYGCEMPKHGKPREA